MVPGLDWCTTETNGTYWDPRFRFETRKCDTTNIYVYLMSETQISHIIFRVHHLRVTVPFQHLESCSLLQHTRLPEQMHWGETLATKVNNTIQCDIHESRPHQAELLHVPSCSILYRTIRHGGVKLWNYIVKIIGCSVSFVAFKNHINGFLMIYQIRLYAIYYKTICNLLLFLETVAQAKPLNTFKNRLDQFWSNQEIQYNFEAPLKTGTGILKLLIDEEDLIIEESQESCDQNHLKVF